MATTVSLASGGPGTWTPYAKMMRSQYMYLRGKNFIAAAILLHREKGDEFVVLHLFAQGVEIVLKALLLLNDFESHFLKVKKYGHNLSRIAAVSLREFGQKPLRPRLADELGALGNLYSQHLLRYSSFYDILVQPNTIRRDAVVSRILAVIRLADRVLASSAARSGQDVSLETS